MASAQAAAAAFSFLTIFLVLGHLLRSKFEFLRKLYLPSSLIAGLLGFTVLNLLNMSPAARDFVAAEITVGWADLPSFLTNIVFTTLVLGESIPSLREVRVVSGPQLCMGQILAFGQYTISVALTGLWFIPSYDGVTPAFGAVVPIGLEGGHGVAAGMRDALTRQPGNEQYYDLSLMAATLGLFVGTFVGWATVNYGLRYGKFAAMKTTKQVNQPAPNWWKFNGTYDKDKRPIFGHQTVAPESVDSLALHLGAIGLATTLGWTVKQGLVAIEHTSPWLEQNEFFSSFPLFPFSLLGALCVQTVLDYLGDTATLAVDRSTMERISGCCMDYLVMAAIIELDVSAPGSMLEPFFLCFAFCCLWSIVAMVTIGRLLPDFWLERSLTELGLALGATATALLMLRMVDPDNKTILLRSFCFKQIFHVMICGGGVFTSTSVIMLDTVGPLGVALLSGGCTLFWLGLLVCWSHTDSKVLQQQRRERDAEAEDGETVRLLSG